MSKVFKKFMKNVVNGLRSATETANEIGFIVDMMSRPIGIVSKNYNYIRDNITRNIGNGIPYFDGYGTPIGSLADPILNEKSSMPFFYNEWLKKTTSNYLDYIDKVGIKNENLFGYSKLLYLTDNNLSLKNNKVDTNSTFKVKSKDGEYKVVFNTVNSYLNDGNDTILKNNSNFILKETLINSIYENKRFKGYGISENAYENFGVDGDKGFGEISSLMNRKVNSNLGVIGFSDFNDIKLSKKTLDFIKKSKLGINLLKDINVDKISLPETDYPSKYYNSSFNQFNRFTLYTYGEPDGNVKSDNISVKGTFNGGTMFSNYATYALASEDDIKNGNYDIIDKTNKLFNDGKIKTLISRFHTDKLEIDPSDGTSTAVSKEYGMSHGRNLLKKDKTNENGYDNPYCRVWTYHHQYHRIQDCIRPIDKEDVKTIFEYRVKDSYEKFSKNTVKGENGLVIFGPTKKSSNNKDGEKENYEIKRCMFSIENLAWKGEKRGFDGHENQKGPFGGRIMWFPPYDLKFNENVSVNWNQTQFIGRGESIYTYTNTERSGNLSFKLLIDHPSILNSYKDDYRTGDVDDIDSTEQQILRFFAGCGKITKGNENNDDQSDKNEIVPKPKDPVVKHTSYKEIAFFVFFPNDYSGVDDSSSGKVSAMEYLINGVGTNKTYNDNKKKFEDVSSVLSKTLNGYEMSSNNNGISNIDGKMLGIYGNGKEPITINNIKIYPYKATNKNGKTNYWGYRVDEAYKNEVLIKNEKLNNYCDTTSFQLNSVGYHKLVDVHTDAKKYKEKGTLYSFTDIFSTLNKNYGTPNKEISSLLENYNVSNVEITGYASSHGIKSNNNSLSRNRAKSVMKWLNKCMPNKFSMDKLKFIDAKIGSQLKTKNVSDFNAKIWRCVKVIIKLETEAIIDGSLNTDGVGLLSNGSTSYHYSVNLNPNDVINKKEYNGYNNGILMSEIVNNSAIIKKKLSELPSENEKSKALNNENNKEQNEYEYFQELSTKEPFLHRKIVDKIKYFDPAFHSITPEGFQSRLTFLHQCTRQGNTNANSDSNSRTRTAGNLSFGRPPICVLRIGDFYYTKIIIDSLSINYDDGTWDLNDEGIGVMPMMANVNISFKFLGGSDLTGPITRLQNALSFNHYANTFTYDDRAEEVEYDENGNISKFKAKI